jgi:hypothetical protein
MRVLTAGAVALIMTVTGAFAANDAVATKGTGALAPGKPAGVKQAQELGDATLVIVGIAAIAAAAIIAGTTGNSAPASTTSQ